MKKIFILLLTVFVHIRAEISIIRDLETEDFLFHVIEKIYKTIGSNKKPKIYIIKNDSINAFATLDDYIFVYTGLFTKLDNATQLFSVLSHEVGHIIENHVARKLGYIKKLNILLPFLINEYMHFGSSEEKVADLFAINILKKNQYSLQEFKNVMQKFFQNEVISYTPDIRKNILNKLDHPSSVDRIETIEQYIKIINYQPKTFDHELEQKFARIKCKLLGFLKDEQEFKLSILNIKAQKDDIAYGAAMMQKKLYNFDESLKILDHLIQKEPDNHYLLIEKAEILFQQGNLDKSIKILQNILKQKKSLYVQLLLAKIILSKTHSNEFEIKALINKLESIQPSTVDEEYSINHTLIGCYTLIKNEPMRLFYIAKNIYIDTYEEAFFQGNTFAKNNNITKIKSILKAALKKTNQNISIKNKINSFLKYISSIN